MSSESCSGYDRLMSAVNGVVADDCGQTLDSAVVRCVVGAVYRYAEALGVGIAWVYSQECTPEVPGFPGRNFAVMGKPPGGMVAWTVWLDERNYLLDPDALASEAGRHIALLKQNQSASA